MEEPSVIMCSLFKNVVTVRSFALLFIFVLQASLFVEL